MMRVRPAEEDLGVRRFMRRRTAPRQWHAAGQSAAVRTCGPTKPCHCVGDGQSADASRRRDEQHGGRERGACGRGAGWEAGGGQKEVPRHRRRRRPEDPLDSTARPAASLSRCIVCTHLSCRWGCKPAQPRREPRPEPLHQAAPPPPQTASCPSRYRWWRGSCQEVGGLQNKSAGGDCGTSRPCARMRGARKTIAVNRLLWADCCGPLHCHCDHLCWQAAAQQASRLQWRWDTQTDRRTACQCRRPPAAT